jgi:hypothetical protein
MKQKVGWARRKGKEMLSPKAKGLGKSETRSSHRTSFEQQNETAFLL